MKKSLLFFVALLCASVAMAATTNTPWSAEIWQLKLDAVNIGPPFTGAGAKAACQAAASVRTEARHASGNWFCHGITASRVTYSAAPPPCPIQPSTTTATIACAAGLAPPWQQTTTVIVSAPPACVVTTDLTPPSAPSTACQPITQPTGTVLHFSDCQAGAIAGCVAGNDANPGTPEAPKRSPGSVNVNGLPGGSSLRLARGGNWGNVSFSLNNPNATVAAPLVWEAYTPSWATDSSPRPELQSNVNLFNVGGQYGNVTQDGGYTFRNLRLNGVSPVDGSRAFFVHSGTRAVLIDNVEMVNFGIAMEVQNVGSGTNQGLTVKNSRIALNSRMGLLGDAIDLVLENNLIEANNFSGSGFNHGVYLGGHGTNGLVKGNRFINNSVVNGVCLGGNLTVHGQWDGLVIEGNTIEVPSANPGCYGISINDGYDSVEFFRNVVVRGNTIDQVESGIAIRAAPGILIEGNTVRSNQSIASGVVISPPPTASDDPGLNPTVRNNVFCLQDPAAGEPVRVNVAGGTASGNVTRRGADATTGACAR